jgi:serine/threonine protein kinase
MTLIKSFFVAASLKAKKCDKSRRLKKLCSTICQVICMSILLVANYMSEKSLKQEKMSIRRSTNFFTLRALAFLHEQNILHRDVKPQKMLLFSQVSVVMSGPSLLLLTQISTPFRLAVSRISKRGTNFLSWFVYGTLCYSCRVSQFLLRIVELFLCLIIKLTKMARRRVWRWSD